MPMLLTGPGFSRAVTADPLVDGRMRSAPWLSEDSSAFTTGGCPAPGALAIPRRDFHELLSASVRGLMFAVTIARASAEESSHVVLAASRGAEDLYECSRCSLLGKSGRFLDAQDEETDLEVEAKIRTAHVHGAETTVFQTQRKASGELFKAMQYKRGMTFGTDPTTGDELWYVLTVSFDVTAEAEREKRGDRSVDYDFYQESALSIAIQVKSKISDAISYRLSNKTLCSDGLKCGKQPCDGAIGDGEVQPLHISTPSWVACPPASKVFLSGI